MPNSVASSKSNVSLIPSNLNSRKKQTPNFVPGSALNGGAGSRRPSVPTRSPTPRYPLANGRRPSSQMSHREDFGDPMHLQSGNVDIKDMVKDAVKEYFDSLNLPQLVTSDTNKQQPTEFKGYNEDGEEVWAVVRKDPMAELLNTNVSRPNSRMATMRGGGPHPTNGLQRSKTQYWNDDVDFQNNLQSWASTAPNHEREIVKNLLKRLNGGQTPAEMNTTQQPQQLPLNTDRSLRASGLGVSGHFEPIQYQCDLSMFTKPPYNPSRHFTINPEWTSERYTVKRIPAAHLHPSATLKNKLGLLRS